MKYHKLETVIKALNECKNEIEIDSRLFKGAASSITKMFEITESEPNNKNYWEGPKR